ncbi:MAG: hypothetical protein JRI89_17080 [Deltaproteobacteria bacterium]|nr:hypothetical protein [Deltaproteobacteria bacterium]
MNRMIRCKHCRRLFRRNPRVKNQRYCGSKVCQRARKTLWQRQRLATDADYQANQRECQRRWLARNRTYWREYRSRHPGYCRRNRLLQKVRDRKRRLQHLAKMDVSEQLSSIKAGTYYLLSRLAKMDASAEKVLLIPAA